MSDTAISGLTVAGTPSVNAVGVIADTGVDYKISLPNMVKAGGAVILNSTQQTGSASITGSYTAGTSVYGATSALVIGTLTFGTLSRGSVYDDGTNAILAAVAGGGLKLLSSGGTYSAILSTSGAFTLSTGPFVVGSTSIANGASTINGALAIVGALTGATTINASGVITGSSFSGSGSGLSAASIPLSALVTAPVTTVTASGNLSSSGGTTPAITMTATPSFNSLTLSTTPLAVASGGTGSTTQNFVDLTSNQNIGGTKTFSGTVNIPATGITAGTLNIGAGGAQTGILPIANGGTAALSLAASPFAVLNPASQQTGALKVSLTVQSGTSFTFATGNSIFSPTSLTLASGVIISAGTGTYSSWASPIAGDSVVQRTASSGYRWWGGATANASLDFGGTTAGVFTLSAPLNISGALAVTGAITATTNITATGTVSMAYSFMRNKIINGAIAIDQRNNGASVTPASGSFTYGVDRWKFYATQASKYTVQQSAGGPSGFGDYCTITSSSAYSLIAGDLFEMVQTIEANNCTDLAFGTASAETVTLSFWVYTSLTGTFGGSIQNYAGTRSYPFTYSIPSANTWTKLTVTAPGDTSGTWVTTGTSGSLNVIFGLGVGTTYSGTSGTWASASYASATGSVNILGTNGATWHITGIQLETGSVATPFEQRLYGLELSLCQRYYYLINPGTTETTFCSAYAQSTTLCFGHVPFPQVMRVTPTLTATGTVANWQFNSVSACAFSALPTIQFASPYSCMIVASLAGPTTAGFGGSIFCATAATLAFSAEL